MRGIIASARTRTATAGMEKKVTGAARVEDDCTPAKLGMKLFATTSARQLPANDSSKLRGDEGGKNVHAARDDNAAARDKPGITAL